MVEGIGNPTHKHGDIGPMSAAISMKIVEHNEIEAVRIRDYGPIESILPRHQEFEHHEVGEEDIGLRLADALTFLTAFLASVASESRTQLIRQFGLINEF